MLLLLLVMRLTNGLWPLRRFAISGPRVLRKLAALVHDVYLDGRGSYIPLDAVFDGEPVFPHGPSGIMVSGGARIGPDAVIFHQVTIGSNTLADSRGFGFPTVGANCYLGAGAKVIGAVTLGDNVRVGANAVVTRDVPSNTVVTGTNEQHPRDDLDNRYFANRDGWQFWRGGKWQQADGGPGCQVEPTGV